MNNVDQFKNEIDNLNKIFFGEKNQKNEIYHESKTPESNTAIDYYSGYQQPQQMATNTNYIEPMINNFYDDFFNFESELPDQLLNEYQNVKEEPHAITTTGTCLENPFINNIITETNNLIYNSDMLSQSNSSIEIIKINDVKYKSIDMPIFDELILLNNVDSKTSTIVADANNKPSKNINNENEEDLLPWEKHKRSSMCRTSRVSIILLITKVFFFPSKF